MSYNIPERELRHIKLGTLQAELDVASFSKIKRTQFINILSGKKRTSNSAYLKVFRYYNIPYIANGCLIRTPLPASYLECIKNALDYERLICTDARKVSDIKQAIDFINKYEEGDIIDYVPWHMYYIDWNKNPVMNAYIIPIPKDNPVWEIINKLKQGENPTIYMQY